MQVEVQFQEPAGDAASEASDGSTIYLTAPDGTEGNDGGVPVAAVAEGPGQGIPDASNAMPPTGAMPGDAPDGEGAGSEGAGHVRDAGRADAPGSGGGGRGGAGNRGCGPEDMDVDEADGGMNDGSEGEDHKESERRYSDAAVLDLSRRSQEEERKAANWERAIDEGPPSLNSRGAGVVAVDALQGEFEHLTRDEVAAHLERNDGDAERAKQAIELERAQLLKEYHQVDNGSGGDWKEVRLEATPGRAAAWAADREEREAMASKPQRRDRRGNRFSPLASNGTSSPVPKLNFAPRKTTPRPQQPPPSVPANLPAPPRRIVRARRPPPPMAGGNGSPAAGRNGPNDSVEDLTAGMQNLPSPSRQMGGSGGPGVDGGGTAVGGGNGRASSGTGARAATSNAPSNAPSNAKESPAEASSGTATHNATSNAKESSGAATYNAKETPAEASVDGEWVTTYYPGTPPTDAAVMWMEGAPGGGPRAATPAPEARRNLGPAFAAAGGVPEAAIDGDEDPDLDMSMKSGRGDQSPPEQLGDATSGDGAQLSDGVLEAGRVAGKPEGDALGDATSGDGAQLSDDSLDAGRDGDNEAVRACGGCDKFVAITALQRCDNCRAIEYCSRDCQIRHWRAEHKLQCKQMKKLLEEEDRGISEIVQSEVDALMCSQTGMKKKSPGDATSNESTDASMAHVCCSRSDCQEISCFGNDKLERCRGRCGNVVCNRPSCSESLSTGGLLCTDCRDDANSEAGSTEGGDDGEGDGETNGERWAPYLESLKSDYSLITFGVSKLCWFGQIQYKDLANGKKLKTSQSYALVASAALAVDANIASLGWTQGGGKNNRVLRPKNYDSLLAFAGDYLEQREQILDSPEFRAKFADLVRPDLALAGGDETELVAGALELVLEDVKRGKWPSDRGALQTTVSNLEEIVAALQDCDTLDEYDGPDFWWNDLPELQLEEIQLERQNGMIRKRSRAIAHYFGEKRGNGSWQVRRALRPHWSDTAEQLEKKMQEGDAHAAKCLYEMLRMDYDDFEVPEEYEGNPQELPLEKMKACSLEYLHEKSIVKPHYIPRFLLPSGEIEDITDVNVRQCEIDSFREEVTPALLAQRDRIERQLKEVQKMSAIKDQRVEKLRSVLAEEDVVECLEWFERCQGANPPAETLADFKEGLQRRLKKIGLGSVNPARLGMPTEDQFNNPLRRGKNQLSMTVGILKDRVAKMLDCNGECPHPRCNRKLLDYDPRACSMGFPGDHTLHDEGKNGHPAQLALTTDGRYRNELADKGVLNTCNFHHDPADVHRSEELDPLKFVRLLPADSQERDSHRTADKILEKGSNSLLTFSVFVLDMDRRGCMSPSNCCDMNSLRTMVDAHFSEPGNIVLVDESTLRTASQWNADDAIRDQHSKAILKNLLMRQHNVCYGAGKLASAEAEARARAGDDLAEDDYVCKRGDFDLRNLPAAELWGIHGDHFGKKKNCNPAELVHKSVIELFDEHFLFRYTCCFCHSIRTWHQNRNGKNAEPCYHTG